MALTYGMTASGCFLSSSLDPLLSGSLSGSSSGDADRWFLYRRVDEVTL